MAGVGFALKKLFSARTVAGNLRAYSYTAAITAGPFALLTGMVLGVQVLFHLYGADTGESANIFTDAIVYAFIFSQILTAGFAYLCFIQLLPAWLGTIYLTAVKRYGFGRPQRLRCPGE